MCGFIISNLIIAIHLTYVGIFNLTVLTNLNIYIPILKVEFLLTFNRSERWRKPDHGVIVRTCVHAKPVQLVFAGQPPRNRHRRRRRRRRTPSDAAHEPDQDKPTARSHTDCLHEWSDESHFGCLLPAPTDASTVLHVVLISPPEDPTRSDDLSPFSSIQTKIPPSYDQPRLPC